MDSKQNVWFTVISGDMIGKWDRQTGSPPSGKFRRGARRPMGSRSTGTTTSGSPSSVAADRQVDPRTEQFTEYAALTQPCTIRRLGIDSTGMVWYAGFNNGKVAGSIPDRDDPRYDVPLAHSEPYDVWPDRQDNIWISDGGQAGP